MNLNSYAVKSFIPRDTFKCRANGSELIHHFTYARPAAHDFDQHYLRKAHPIPVFPGTTDERYDRNG